MAPPVKKSLKLSRNHAQKLEKVSSPLDDSMDDFIVSRPLKTERKGSKSNLGSASKAADNKELMISSTAIKTEITNEPIEGKSTAGSVASCVKDEDESRDLEASAHINTIGSVAKENLTHPLPPKSLQLKSNKPSDKRRTRRKQAADECDLSLALAISESIQLANESARMQEEEILLAENCAEAISSLREEEQATGIFGHVFQKPNDIPVTKVKRKPKASSKKETRQYTLALRSQSERERLIAERAATILSGEPDDPLKPSKITFTKSRPASEYLSQFLNSENLLWERASLSSERSNLAENEPNKDFYVDNFRSIISPPKKKSGYSNILLHLSQLPGRGSTQMEKGAISETQILLEELAYGAEGGFMDESYQQVGHTASGPSSDAINKLTEDWSGLLDTPLMSDLIIRTSNKDIHAHRLVFAVRSPRISESITKSEIEDKYVLDWSTLSSSSALRVLRFIYAASYEHDEKDEPEVRRIARRYKLSGLIDLLPASGENSYSTCEDSENDVELEVTFESSPAKTTTKVQSNFSVNEPTRETEISIIQDDTLSRTAETNNTFLSTSAYEVFSPRRNPIRATPLSAKPSPSKDPVYILENSEVLLEAEKKEETIEQPSLNSSWENNTHSGLSTTNPSAIAGITSSSNMDISSGVTSLEREVPLSPDMFHESLSEVDDEDSPPRSPEDVIDLTQSSGNQSERAFSPLAASCEMEASLENKSENDVSMLECSIVSPSTKSVQRTPSKSSLQKTWVEDPIASCSRSVAPFVHSVSPGNDYSITDDHFIDRCASPMSDKIEFPCSSRVEIAKEFANPPTEFVNNEYDDFPEELDSIFPQEVDPSPLRPTRSTLLQSEANMLADMNTPDPPRQAKKRKIEVTPQPDYETMETPLLKKELNKFGLKPVFKRKQAVKLLHHIYEELHPLVTDTESSFQDTPERPAVATHRQNPQPAVSPSKSLEQHSSLDESESGHSQEDEESMIVMEMDREDSIKSDSPSQSLQLKERIHMFLKSRPEIHEKVLTYEPISFEYLVKELRAAGIRCKAQTLLDLLDEECITCRMKSRNRNGPKVTEQEDIASSKASGASPRKSPRKPVAKGRRVAKKLIS